MKSINGFWKGRKKLLGSAGQGVVEYVLILAVIISIALVVARPFFETIRTSIGESFSNGIFNEKSDFYYFPVKP